MLSEEQYKKDAAVLKKAMEGWGCNENEIVNLCTARNNADRLKIADIFKNVYNKDLIKELESELSGDVKKTVIGMFRSFLDYDCHELMAAMKGVGTDEDALIEIIGSRDCKQLVKIKERFKELFKIDLIEEVKDETSGDLQKLLVALLECNRRQDDIIDESKLNKDIANLFDAGEGTWGTDESTFIKIFAQRSHAELRYINNEYYKCCGTSLKDVVESEFSGDTKNLLITILHSILNPVDFFATKIRNACKGMGTDDTTLIRVLVSRDEIDLKDIKAIYHEKFDLTLYDEIKDETSGAYKNILMGIAMTD